MTNSTSLQQVLPPENLIHLPCSLCSLHTAFLFNSSKRPFVLTDEIQLYQNGYMTLKGMNRMVRDHLAVKKYVQYPRGSRPTLLTFNADKNAHFSNRAIICVYGHYLYWEPGYYYSFFSNEYDEVVAIWFLKQ